MTFSDYAARGKNAWWRYLVASVVGFLGGMVVVSLALYAAMAAHWAPANLTEEIKLPVHPLVFFPATGLIFGGLALGFVAAARLIQGKRFGDIVGRWRWRDFCWGAGLWLAVSGVTALIDFAIHPRGFTVTASAETWGLAIAALFGLAIQTFAEEFIFRGYLTQGLLLATRRPLAAALLSGAMFGALHIPNGTPQAIEATAFGIVTAMIAIRTGGIAFSYGVHIVNNLFGALVVVSADDVFKGAPGLFAQKGAQLVGWDAGFQVVALAIALWVAIRMMRLD